MPEEEYNELSKNRALKYFPVLVQYKWMNRVQA